MISSLHSRVHFQIALQSPVHLKAIWASLYREEITECELTKWLLKRKKPLRELYCEDIHIKVDSRDEMSMGQKSRI